MRVECNVCGTCIGLEKCSYCGYINPDVLANENISDYVKRDAAKYRQDTLSKLRCLSIRANVYQWNAAANQYKQKGDVELFDSKLNGTDCFKAPKFSKEWIAHTEGQANITVEYTFGSTPKRVTAKVQFEPKEGIWYLGLHINESLRLEILLGVKPVDGDSITETKKLCTLDLDFHENRN